MNNEEDDLVRVERQLKRVTPRSAPEHLRRSVLEAISGELTASRRRRLHWDRRLALVAAVLLLAGVALNAIVLRSGQSRLAKLLEAESGPSAIKRYVTFIEPVTDPSNARRVEQQLLVMTSKQTPRVRRNKHLQDEYLKQVQRVLNEWPLIGGGFWNGQTLENRQMDQHRSGNGYRGALDHSRDPQLAGELAA